MIIIAGFITPHSGRSLYVGIGMDGELLSQYGDSLKFSDAPANVFQENFVLNLGGEDALRSPFRARSAVEAVSAS